MSVDPHGGPHLANQAVEGAATATQLNVRSGKSPTRLAEAPENYAPVYFSSGVSVQQTPFVRGLTAVRAGLAEARPKRRADGRCWPELP